MALPNFLILGTPRAGTTSLYYWLRQHPSVFMSPVKEPHYFAVEDGDSEHRAWDCAEFVRTRAQYEGLFEGSKSFEAVGDASTTYLESHGAPRRIAETLGAAGVRLICILRNPAERAFSHYCDHRSDRSEPIARFRDAWEESARRAAREKRIDWDYVAPGFYARHVERYLRFFDLSQMKLILFEDLAANPRAVLSDICRHLDIDPSFEFDTSTRHNSARLIAGGAIPALAGRSFNAIQRLFPQPMRAGVMSGFRSVIMQKPVLSAGDRAELVEVYQSDIQRLGRILDRPLDHWLAGGRSRSETAVP